MYLMEIISGPVAEKITLIAALLVAVTWLWREISSLNKRRDEDLKMWKDSYTQVMEKLIVMEKESARVIERNSIVIEQFTEVMEKVNNKLKV